MIAHARADPDDLPRCARCIVTAREDGQLESHAGTAQTPQSTGDRHDLIKTHWCVVVDEIAHGMKIDWVRTVASRSVDNSQITEKLSQRRIEPGQIVRVENDLLAIDLRVADPEKAGERIVRTRGLGKRPLVHALRAMRPPSTGITAPVMKLAAGRHSDTVICATSSGSP